MNLVGDLGLMQVTMLSFLFYMETRELKDNGFFSLG
jgi:hypothetical protein